jgi:hypothetical protein
MTHIIADFIKSKTLIGGKYDIYEETTNRVNSRNAFYYSVYNLAL